jgi:hypothetical protein
MADSYAKQILVKFESLLNTGANKPAGVTVARSRRRPSEPGELPLYLIRPSKEQVQKIGSNVNASAVERTLDVLVTLRAQGNDDALDLHRDYVVRTLMADPGLGGLAIEVTEDEHDWEAEDASDADYAEDVIKFAVRYKTPRTST